MMHTLLGSDNLKQVIFEDAIPLLAISGGLLIVLIGIIMGTVRKTVAIRERETSRREIAAYVAEGTMSSDDAYKILNAGTGKGCWSKKDQL